MFLNYLKIAYRGYLRNQKFSILNLMSLITGLLIAYMGISYISYETGFEGFHKDSDKIYRLARTYRAQDYSVIGFPSWSESSAEVQRQQVEVLKGSPGIEEVTQFITTPFFEYVRFKENQVSTDGILITNTPSGFVDMFTWQPVFGSLDDFSTGLNKVLLTESLAEKLFGPEFLSSDDLINSQIQVGGVDYELAAIIQDVPANSHFYFNLAMSNERIENWGSRVYLKVLEYSNLADVESQLNATIASFNPRLQQDPLYAGHFLQPIESIHLNSDILYESKAPGKPWYITLIGFFAGFILILTLFNYANLTLAIKSKESKTIGIRKAMGAQNGMIISQFLIEGILLSLLALPIVALLISLIMPYFNALMGTDISANLLSEPIILLVLVGLAIVVGALAGLSPALYLGLRGAVSLFKEDLKQSGFQSFPVRKYLLLSQFVMLIAITCVSFFISQQLAFVEGKDIGFKKEGILYAYTSAEIMEAFQQRVRQIPGVLAVGNGSSLGIQAFNQLTYRLDGSETVFDDSNQLYMDPEGLNAYGIKTTLPEIPQSRITLINQTAAAKFANLLGVKKEDLIGIKVITEPEYTNEETGEVGIPFTIGGIFEDIHLFSLHEKIEPYFLTLSGSVRMDGRSIVSYYPENEAEVLQEINSIYDEFKEPIPLELEYLGENVAKLYEQDRQIADLLHYFNLIAVFLASLGIIGVTIFMAMARRKEIGIRKVLGAPVLSIIHTFIREYIYLIGIAMLIAWPISYFTAKTWLANFAYKIEINHVVFVLVGTVVLALAMAIVGVITFKVAQDNPVKSLRTD